MLRKEKNSGGFAYDGRKDPKRKTPSSWKSGKTRIIKILHDCPTNYRCRKRKEWGKLAGHGNEAFRKKMTETASRHVQIR
jgi:hypothetical protein